MLYFGVVVYVAVTVYAYFMTSVIEFYVLAVVVGLVQGGVQAISRSLYARFVPAAQSGEFFGFFNMLGRFAAIVGPSLVAVTGLLTGSSRLGILSVIVVLVIGAVLLTFVREQEAAPARREPAGRRRAPPGARSAHPRRGVPAPGRRPRRLIRLPRPAPSGDPPRAQAGPARAGRTARASAGAGFREAVDRPPAGSPSVTTCPLSTRRSIAANTERPAAGTRPGASPAYIRGTMSAIRPTPSRKHARICSSRLVAVGDERADVGLGIVDTGAVRRPVADVVALEEAERLRR